MLKKLFLVGMLFGLTVFAQDPSLTVNATIAQNASLSDGVLLKAGCIPGALIIPIGWTAANITFQVSNDGGTTYGVLKDEYNQVVTITVGSAGDVIRLAPSEWYWVKNRRIKIQSGIPGATVTQLSSAKVVKVLCGR